MIFHNLPEISGGILLARLGHVHQQATTRGTRCGELIPARFAPVAHVQAVAHKIPLCHTCYPHHHGHGGGHAHR